MKTAPPTAPEICPVCGADVPPRARSCRACGADPSAGWQESAGDGVDLPDEDFDYADFVAREFGGAGSGRRIHPVWWLTTVVLLVALGWWLIVPQ